MKKRICLAISAILVLVYLLILYYAFHPTVSKEYEVYYITHEIGWKPDDGAFSYTLGDIIYPTSQEDEINFQRFAKGFGEVEKDGVWTRENEALIFFSELPKEDLVFTIIFNGCMMEEADVLEVFFNDILMETLSANEIVNPNGYRHIVPKKLIGRNGYLKVTLKCSNNQLEKGVKCRCIHIDRNN